MKKFITLLFFLFNFKLIAITLDEVNFMSEEFPPYNFKEMGKPSGSSVEILKLILKDSHSKKNLKDITFYPWARSYETVLKEKNTVLFVTTKTADREKLFKWVGPISKAENMLIGKKTKAIDFKSVEAINKLAICAVSKDAGEDLVKEKFSNLASKLTIVTEPSMCINMLSADRVDLFAYDKNVVKWMIKKAGFNWDEYEAKLLLAEGEHYFAFNINTPDELIVKIQKSLDRIKKTKDYELIKRKFFNN